MTSQAAVPEFFHRIEGLNLVPGNKTAGFDAVMSTEMLQRLRQLKMSDAAQQGIHEELRERIRNAGLLLEPALGGCGIGFLDGTWCPRFFTTGPEAASIGAVPTELEPLPARDALEWLGATVTFSPHNVDSPFQALALLVMVETWAEQARFALLSGML